MSLPIPDLDNKIFSQIIEEAKARLPVLAPEWTDYNLSDPGITILELLAWLTDVDIYRLNRITEKHILKFLKLLNALPEPVNPAKTWITFSLPEDYGNGIPKIPEGTKLIARENDKSIYFETTEDIYIHPVKPKKIVLSNERGLTEYDESPLPRYFYAFGEEARENSYFYIAFNKAFKNEFSLTFILYEDDLPLIGKHGKEIPKIIPSAAVEWSYWNGGKWEGLKLVKDETLHLFQSGSVIFKEISDMGKRRFPSSSKEEFFFIRCELKKAGYEIVPRIKKVLIAKGKQQNLWHQYQIEKDIEKLITALYDEDALASSDELEFEPKKIEHKVDNTMSNLTKRKIKNNVSDYFRFIKKRLFSIDSENPGAADIILLQVRHYYLKQKQKEKNQQTIYDNIVKWILKKTNSPSVDAADILASFFVQNCEVFE